MSNRISGNELERACSISLLGSQTIVTCVRSDQWEFFSDFGFRVSRGTRDCIGSDVTCGLWNWTLDWTLDRDTCVGDSVDSVDSVDSDDLSDS